MKIVSPFHDYYDTALGFGIDTSIMYDRRETEIELQPNDFKETLSEIPSHRGRDYWRKPEVNEFDAVPIIVGFCGRLYPGYEIEFYRPGALAGGWDRLFAFSMDALKRCIVEAEPDGLRWFCRKRDKYSSVKWNRPSFTEGGVEAYFSRGFPEFERLFQDHKVPVFSLRFERRVDQGSGTRRFNTLTLNPRLNAYSFQKVVDPYTAFQEIMMYITGVLGTGESSTVQISDRMMSEKKGFDFVKSFRRELGHKIRHKKTSCDPKFNISRVSRIPHKFHLLPCEFRFRFSHLFTGTLRSDATF
jgi:hypothetical protein